MELHPYLEFGCIPAARLWHVLAGSGEPPILRVGHGCVHVGAKDRSSGQLYVIGGANPSGTFTETFELDLDNFTWLKHDTPGFVGRYEHSVFVVPAEPTNIYVFGGAYSDGNRNDVQVFDTVTKSWSTVNAAGTPPSPRTFHNGACVGNQLIVYSGGDRGAEPVSDRNTYAFDVVSRRWLVLKLRGDSPKPRHGHMMATVGNQLWLHGGMAGSSFFDDIHVLNIDKGLWMNAKIKSMKPAARAAHGGFVDGSMLYIFGGMNHDGALDDMFQLNTDVMEWTKVVINGTPPEPRLDFAASVVHLEFNVSATSLNKDGSLALDVMSHQFAAENQPIAADRQQSTDESNDTGNAIGTINVSGDCTMAGTATGTMPGYPSTTCVTGITGHTGVTGSGSGDNAAGDTVNVIDITSRLLNVDIGVNCETQSPLVDDSEQTPHTHQYHLPTLPSSPPPTPAAAAAAAESCQCAAGSSSVSLAVILGGMDTTGEVFNDCLVLALTHLS